MGLETSILIEMISFLDSKEKCKISLLCKEFRKASFNPCLWRQLQIFNKQKELKNDFGCFMLRATQLRVLSLKFCPNVSAATLQCIAEYSNSFYLRELYLDGCDKIND